MTSLWRVTSSSTSETPSHDVVDLVEGDMLDDMFLEYAGHWKPQGCKLAMQPRKVHSHHLNTFGTIPVARDPVQPKAKANQPLTVEFGLGHGDVIPAGLTHVLLRKQKVYTP